MTEQEAKTKRCIGPADCGRLVEISKRMTNAGDTLTARIRVCIGSTCMGWRVLGEPIERAEGYVMGFIPQGDGWQCTLSDKGREGFHFQIKSQWERNVPVQGYCGIAGRP